MVPWDKEGLVQVLMRGFQLSVLRWELNSWLDIFLSLGGMRQCFAAFLKFLFIYLFIYLFIGCVGSSLLHAGSL